MIDKNTLCTSVASSRIFCSELSSVANTQHFIFLEFRLENIKMKNLLCSYGIYSSFGLSSFRPKCIKVVEMQTWFSGSYYKSKFDMDLKKV